ncbi:hypothetical protein CGX12_15150 [Zobellella denitrificans]|uniref:Fe-S protein n=1 Tax=Zobellella denitrificans TaxID=347534 RepID=A0A231MVS1_9GAMM|nr:DUF1289 domain-containing protein [Zobellella denitrificans]ATG74371.1 Fe-S protein [Zobellella denitrificans]OXS14278.1 hypothetical protein CGX12_15150 [Zobellella denitrificans]
MEQLEFFDVPSPCIGVCQVNNRGYCKGCFRSREERFNWLTFTPAQRRDVIRLCQDRKRRVLAAARKKQLELELAQQDSPPQDSLPL